MWSTTDRHPRRSTIIDATTAPAYDLGPGHPFARDRLVPLFELLQCSGLVSSDEVVSAKACTTNELESAHTADYIAALSRLSAAPNDAATLASVQRFGIGVGDNPAAPGQHLGAAAAAGGTRGCVDAVVTGRVPRAFNPLGGLHHAMRSSASGFCLYNDLVVGIRHARDLGIDRVAYIDFDVHHGDGVEAAFSEDPNVLTISFHESPDVRWPYTGRCDDVGTGAARGTTINMPFASGTTDASWQRTVRTVLEHALTRFEPQLLVTQHGCDTHATDPLADLSLSLESALFAASLSRKLADHHTGGRWVATGGGGYRPITVLSRAWSALWCVVSGRPVPAKLDMEWRKRWADRARREGEIPETWIDSDAGDRRAAQAAGSNERSLDRLAELQGW